MTRKKRRSRALVCRPARGGPQPHAVSPPSASLFVLRPRVTRSRAALESAHPPSAPPPFDRDDETLLKRRTAYAGTSAELVDRLLDIRRQAGVPVEFVARSHLPMLEYDAQVELMQQLAEEVAPHL